MCPKTHFVAAEHFVSRLFVPERNCRTFNKLDHAFKKKKPLKKKNALGFKFNLSRTEMTLLHQTAVQRDKYKIILQIKMKTSRIKRFLRWETER